MVCAELARRDGRLAGLVFVDYGHPAQTAEAWKTFAYHGRTGVPLHTVHAFGLRLGAMAGGTGDDARIVPARNAMLLAAAVNHAAGIADEVWFGAHAGDDAAYPDCRQSWVAAMSDAMRSAYGVGVAAPLSGMTKAEVVTLARELGIAREDTWSCYEPDGTTPCGACACCIAANKVWATAAVRHAAE